MKIHHLLYIGLALLLAGCSDDTDTVQTQPLRYDLLGRGVSFNASYAEPFTTRVTTYRHDGSFNEGDLMTIYRQYSYNNGLSFDEEESHTAYRVYWLQTKYASGTSTVSLGEEWIPKPGETGYDPDKEPNTFTQTKADSLTWDNGNTVRFRAWSRSNLAAAITNSKGKDNKHRYYPDYSVSDWVTVSGPTDDVSLTMKHLGCRIGIVPKPGNELWRAEVCTELEDYMRPDNSTVFANDESADEHGKTLEKAQEELNSVLAVYNQMCMPAGVDIQTSLLTTMTKAKYLDEATDLSTIHAETDGIVKFGTKTAKEISDDVQRPLFCSNDGRLYMVTIPYVMSNDDSHKGEALTLPACTRFRVWLYDVNDGDKGTNHEESNYHILTLGDVRRVNSNQAMFPNGLELKPGYSYLFSVGYHYDKFTITPADDFAWVDDAPAVSANGTDQSVSEGPSPNYEWWTSAIADAVEVAKTDNTVGYNPVFEIDTREEFLEFIKLVNGTAATKTSGLTRVTKTVKDPDTGTETEVIEWYKDEDMEEGEPKKGATPFDKNSEEAEGYIFYEHYYPANADQKAYSIEDYVRGPYSFYDENLNTHFTVKLTADIDLADWELTPIGNESSGVAFRGVFDGCHEVIDASGKRTADRVYTLKNVNVKGGYLFEYCKDVAIRNLKIETTHDFKLVKTAEAHNELGYGAYIVGISIKAPSAGNPIATTLKGSSYVVACIYQGRATGAMIGKADNLNMYGCMMAAEGLAPGTGALLGEYINSSDKFFAPQTSKNITWGRFMVNYYDTSLSPSTNAVGSIADAYKPQQYIRGSYSYILKAKNDNLIDDEVDWEKQLTDEMKRGYYGLAPWKALNYAIWSYNKVGDEVAIPQNSMLHFENSSDGYVHRYPELVAGAPTEESVAGWNVLEQNN